MMSLLSRAPLWLQGAPEKELDDLSADPALPLTTRGSPSGSPPLPGSAVLVCEVRAVDHAASEVPLEHTYNDVPPRPFTAPKGTRVKDSKSHLLTCMYFK